MPIPEINKHGFLPMGVHDCSIEEIRARFGRFQQSDRRVKLYARLEAFLAEARATRVVRSIIVDGSFVTANPEPNDIDLIVVVSASHDFSADLTPAAYNVFSKRCVHRRFGFDLLVARENSIEYDRWTEFFQQVRLAPGRRKGILRVRL